MPDYTGQKYQIQTQDNGVAAGSDDSFTFPDIPATGRVTEISFTPEAAETGDNTNSRTYQLVNKGNTGAGTTVIGTISLPTGTNLAAFDEKNATLSVTASDLVVTADDVLAWVSTHTGTGTADPGGIVKVTIERAAA